MKIKMLQGIAGADFAFSPGDVTDRFSQAEAIRLIEARIAAPASEAATEKSVKPAAPETRAPFAGKGDHDGNGKTGGAKKPGTRKASR